MVRISDIKINNFSGLSALSWLEHLVYTEGAGGSSPSSPTRFWTRKFQPSYRFKRVKDRGRIEDLGWLVV